MELQYIAFSIANSIHDLYIQTIHTPKKSSDINQPNISTLVCFHKKLTDIVIIFICNRIRFYSPIGTNSRTHLYTPQHKQRHYRFVRYNIYKNAF